MCDVYSFGIIMWEMYSGQRPYLELLQSNRDKRVRDKMILSKVRGSCRTVVNCLQTFPDT